MKLNRSLLIPCLALGLVVAMPGLAATISSGDLIKGPSDAVYYYAANGKRLVFPTEKTFKTWYADFAGVKTLSSADLAVISLGGNVTYRPGVKLVKITTDPKVYAVTKGGVLRWIKTESLAVALYGADWNTKIDDVPDTYFQNYTIGMPIENTSDFVPTQETAAVTDINTDKGYVTTTPPIVPPTPTTTTSTLVFTVSKTTAQAGDILTLIAGVQDGTPVSSIELFFDSGLIKTCYSVSCSGEAQVPVSGTKTSYVAEARLTRQDQQVVIQTVTVPISYDMSGKVKVSVGQSQIMPGQAASVMVDVDSSIAVQRIDIYVDSINIKACTGGIRLCQWSDILQGSVGSVHPVYSMVTDTLGRRYTSPTLNITLSTTDSPSVTVTPAKTGIYSGETVDVTVTATDSDGIAWIEVLKDGAVLKHCDSAAPCTATTGPWSSSNPAPSFTGRAADTLGTIGTGGPVSVTFLMP